MSSQTLKPKNMLVDNATIYVGTFDTSNVDTFISSLTDTNKLGLGKDSVKFSAKPNITEYDFAGKKDAKVVEMQSIENWEVTVEGDCLDFNANCIKLCGLKEKTQTTPSTTYKKYEPVVGSMENNMLDIAIVGKIKDKTNVVAIVVKNGFNTEGVSLEFADKDNNAFTIKAVAHYFIDQLAEAPFCIIAPTVES